MFERFPVQRLLRDSPLNFGQDMMCSYQSTKKLSTLASQRGHSMLLLVVAFLLEFAYSDVSAGLVGGAEYTVLQSIYSKTNGSAWATSTHWMVGDACQWYGVTCDQDTDPTDN